MSLSQGINEIRQRFSKLDVGKIHKKFPHLHESVRALERLQGHVYHDKRIALLSLIHRSALVYWPVDKSGVFSNETLEFLGDAYLNFYVAVDAMVAFPELQEGQLSKLRAAIVGTENLSLKASELGIGKLLLFGKGEMQASGARKKNALADSFEAVTAALFLDGGDEVARSWLARTFSGDFLTGKETLAHFDAKTQFQQWVQAIIGVPPTYRLVGSNATPITTEFIVAGFIGETEIARACAPSKRDASKAVAAKMQSMVDAGELTAEYVKQSYEKKI